MSLYQLISECSDYDFKRGLDENRPKSWLKSVSAFANTIGGTLFFGVDDGRNLIGIDDPQAVSEQISEKINAKIKPVPIYVLTPYREDGRAFIG